jgi:CDP-diacylglycerol---serine O-phosphatidyltransferase
MASAMDDASAGAAISKRSRLVDLLAPRMFFIPDAITSLGLLIGFYALVFAVSGHFVRAAVMIELAILCDGLDGLIARATETASRVGVEYDSLSDVVTFGVAPASLIYAWALAPLGGFGIAICALYVVCAALRLARFNVQTASVGKSRFVGLPVPGAAAAIAGLVLVHSYLGFNLPVAIRLVMVPLTPILALAMISRIPYPTFKAIDWGQHASLETAVAVLIGLALSLAVPQVMAFVAGTAYLLSGPVLMLMGERTAKSVPGFWAGEAQSRPAEGDGSADSATAKAGADGES